MTVQNPLLQEAFSDCTCPPSIPKTSLPPHPFGLDQQPRLCAHVAAWTSFYHNPDHTVEKLLGCFFLRPWALHGQGQHLFCLQLQCLSQGLARGPWLIYWKFPGIGKPEWRERTRFLLSWSPQSSNPGVQYVGKDWGEKSDPTTQGISLHEDCPIELSAINRTALYLHWPTS